MDQPNSRLNFPDRKISETFLEFADPLLAPLGPRATVKQMEAALKIAFTVWNGVVYDKVNGNSHFLDMIRNQTRHNREVAALVERLIARKRKRFGHDDRLVGKFKFIRKSGELRLRAEARDPTTRIGSTAK